MCRSRRRSAGGDEVNVGARSRLAKALDGVKTAYNACNTATQKRKGEEVIAAAQEKRTEAAKEMRDAVEKQAGKDAQLQLLMSWVANSPDLNPVECVWSWLARQPALVFVKDINEHKAVVEQLLRSQEFADFRRKVCDPDRLIRRLRAVIASEGRTVHKTPKKKEE
jgi:hypothetical protein